MKVVFGYYFLLVVFIVINVMNSFVDFFLVINIYEFLYIFLKIYSIVL